MDTKYCLDEIFNLNLKVECISLLLAKFLGILIIVFSSTLKLPQIREMINNKKTISMLNETSLFTDLLCVHSIFLYNYHFGYPFSSYGENVIIEIQNIIILFLFFKEVKSHFLRLFSILIILIVTALCLTNSIPQNIWPYIGNSNTLFLIISRIATIKTNYMQKDVGPLKLIAFILSLGGNLTRIFTTVVETMDTVILMSTAIATLLNLIILLQIIRYQKKKNLKRD